MKIISKMFFCAGIISAMALTSCNKNDDNGPDTPAPTGTFTANITNPSNGSNSTFTAVTATATLDTLTNRLEITFKNTANDVIIVNLNSLSETTYTLNAGSIATDFSTYKKPNMTTAATTLSDDNDAPQSGIVTITSDNTENNTITGTITYMRWYKVDDADVDEEIAFLQNGAFENVPVTKISSLVTGDDVSVAATIDGTAFNPSNTQSISSGGSIIISGTEGTQGLTVSVPSTAAVGNNFSFPSSSGFTVSYTVGSANYFITTGSYAISAFNGSEGTVTGTFSGSATSVSGGSGTTFEITAGTFNVQ